MLYIWKVIFEYFMLNILTEKRNKIYLYKYCCRSYYTQKKAGRELLPHLIGPFHLHGGTTVAVKLSKSPVPKGKFMFFDHLSKRRYLYI